MKDHKTILQEAEEASKSVQDGELRKIAFQEIVRHELLKSEPATSRAAGGAGKRVAKGPSRRRFRAQGTAAKQVFVRSQVKTLDISPDEPGLPTWGSLQFDWKKYCWILEAAKNKGIDGLTASEISFLAETIFRERLDKIFNLKKKIKSGFARTVKIEMGDGRHMPGWKILSEGTKELKAVPAKAHDAK